MKQRDGWWVTDNMTGAGNYISRFNKLVPLVLQLPTRRVVVQAGGHIGVFPTRLSEYFQTVYTFEPEAENFACLTHNTAQRDAIFAARGFLGDVHGTRQMNRHKHSGGHKVSGVETGTVPMYRIDDLALETCDLICLDTEGFEIPALTGAWVTLSRHRPVIICEENKQAVSYGHKIGDIEKLCVRLGYRKVASIGEDIVLRTAP